MPNIEMKAFYPDLARAREIAIQLGGTLLWVDTQLDTYFYTRAGKLKLRESGRNGAELLPYIKKEADGLKRSDYAKLPVEDAVLVKDLLSELLGRKQEVRKTREVYLIGNVRVHLDQVEGLGNFLEFEAVFAEDSPQTQSAEERKVNDLMEQFGVERERLREGSYPELLSQRNPIAAADGKSLPIPV
jgi:predicted adenylyl cyclase CyaB